MRGICNSKRHVRSPCLRRSVAFQRREPYVRLRIKSWGVTPRRQPAGLRARWRLRFRRDAAGPATKRNKAARGVSPSKFKGLRHVPIRIADNLPARRTLESEGVIVMSETEAARQDIRPLRVALLNFCLLYTSPSPRD